MEQSGQKRLTGWINIGTVMGLCLMTAFIGYGIYAGIFTSREKMEAFLKPMGIWAPLMFVGIQAVQVVVPILPGGISCLGGVLLFGPFWGFLYNYVGICIGSFAAFFLARRFGQLFVRSITSGKLYDKYIGWLEQGSRFDRFFALAIFFPVAPDDFLCYLAGLTRMQLKKFLAIILLGKPASIALYSLGLVTVMNTALQAL